MTFGDDAIRHIQELQDRFKLGTDSTCQSLYTNLLARGCLELVVIDATRSIDIPDDGNRQGDSLPGSWRVVGFFLRQRSKKINDEGKRARFSVRSPDRQVIGASRRIRRHGEICDQRSTRA